MQKKEYQELKIRLRKIYILLPIKKKINEHECNFYEL
jgi:hypothetical protein